MRIVILALSVAAIGLALARAAAQQNPPQATTGQDPFGDHHWKAFIDTSGEQPQLRVEGIMTAGSPAYFATVKPATPQGFNRRVLLLNVTHEQLFGVWALAVTDIPVCYHAAAAPDQYDQVTIMTASGARKTLDVFKQVID